MSTALLEKTMPPTAPAPAVPTCTAGRLLPFGPMDRDRRLLPELPPGLDPLDPDRAWAAVLARDARLDGRLYYGVSSTGVYCRPSCPSRRPQRQNVSFYADPAAAEAAGLRACKRCRPEGTTAAREAVEKVLALLDAEAEEPLTLERLGEEVGMSPAHLQRVFKRQVGLSPREYQAARRVERFKARVRSGDDVTTALYEAGYGASSRLYEQADERLGMTPGAYRRGGQGMRIRFTIVGSPFGRLLVAATGRGLCAVTLGDDDAALEAALRREYPQAEIASETPGDEAGSLATWATAVARQLGSPERADLPLDLQATAFQQRVWRALTEIPAGATRSYGEVAAALGEPRAARAVARACATNPVAVIIPCHRVVRGDGDLGGYRWGADRKRLLLERERSAAGGWGD
jgi:AraC family transcriptional regulator of adaptative response/methylated-DNA-[protein]-cysteine methyltransferase